MNKNFMDSKLIDELCKDKAFFETLFTLENDEDIKKAFLDKGLEMSDEDIEFFKNAVVKTLNNGNEIPDEILDNVSGGKDSWMSKNWGKVIGCACAITATGAAVWGVRKLVSSTSGTCSNLDDAANEMKSAIGNVNSAVDKIGGAADSISETASNVNEKLEMAGSSRVGKFFGLGKTKS